MQVASTEWMRNGLPDADLLASMRAGDPAAFALLMRNNNQRLFRLARGFLRDDAEAEEVVQDSYVRAFTHLESFRGGSSLATWLARIVSNEALGRLRRRPPTSISGTSQIPSRQSTEHSSRRSRPPSK